MTKTLIVEDDARVELRAAAMFYEKERAGLGRDFLAAVEEAFDGLIEGTATPLTVPSVPNDLGIRRAILARFPFAIVYVHEGDTVHVLAVAHLRREPTYWLSRARR
jgi:plasmid stabilization system protein ParE